jgi:hypothetical protein
MSLGVLRCIEAVLRPCDGCGRGSASLLIVTVFFTRLLKFVFGFVALLLCIREVPFSLYVYV